MHMSIKRKLSYLIMLWAVFALTAHADVSVKDNNAFEKRENLGDVLRANSTNPNAMIDITKLPDESRKHECSGLDANGEYLDDGQDAPGIQKTKAKAKGLGISAKKCNKFSDQDIKSWRQDSVTVVDIRSTDQYASWHVPGSLNIPEYAVKTKTYLKPTHLVLMDDGLSNLALMSACKSLLATGFKNVSIVEGGVQRWRQLIGTRRDRQAVDRMQLITPKQYLTVMNEYRWLVIALDVDLTATKSLFGRSHYLVHSESGGELSHQLDLLKKKNGSLQNHRLLVVNQKGNDYSKLDRHALTSQLDSVYFMEGGLEEYRSYLSMHSAMIAKVNAKPIRRNECGI